MMQRAIVARRMERRMRMEWTRSINAHALDRLQLDINSHHDQDQLVKDPADPVQKSAAAIRGESFVGDVQLPEEFMTAVEKAIEDGEDKAGVRLKALDLYTHLRGTAAISSAISTSYRDRQALLTTYDVPTSLAYLAGLMPSIYGATVSVFTSARDRLRLLDENWSPDRIIDYGSGTASAAWAMQEVWGPIRDDGIARQYIGLDSSRAMIELSSTMLGALPIADPTFPPAALRLRMNAATYQLPLPATISAMAKLHISPASSLPGTGLKTIALASFSLGDLGSKEKRKDMVREMWDSGAEVIVIIDRGTPMGSRIVAEAREQLLMLGRRSLKGDPIDGLVEAVKGCFILAPCPHDGVCPLHNSTRSYCHFSQRVRSPPFLRHTKHTTRGEDDAKFSYIVVQRGSRPLSSASSAYIAQQEGVDLAETVSTEALGMDRSTDVGDELEWPRLVAAPMKRSGHVILEVCAVSGEVERHTIPKSQGRQEYYDARKVRWGDSFPHPPKNGAMLAPKGREEDVVDKFGKGRSKLKSKKAERTGRGAGSEVEQGENTRRNRRTRRDQENHAAGVDSSERAGGDGGGVKEYELEMDSDGQFKLMD